MIFNRIYLVLPVILSFVNSAIIVQAPKYVPKKALESLVRQYYLQLKTAGMRGPNRGIEIEIPVSVPSSQLYRYLRRQETKTQSTSSTTTTAPTTKQTQTPQQIQIIAAPDSVMSLGSQIIMSQAPIFPPDLHYALASENLRQAEEAVAKHLDEHQETSNGNEKSLSSSRSNKKEIYQEDVEKALDELEARLQSGGNRPATLEDLMKMIDEVEEKILAKQEMLVTSTPDPCGEERILQEALKPALKEDLWEAMKFIEKCGARRDSLGEVIDAIAKTDDETRRAIELTLNNPEKDFKMHSHSHEEVLSEARRTIGREIIDLLQDNPENEFNSSTVSTKNIPQQSLGAQLIHLLKHANHRAGSLENSTTITATTKVTANGLKIASLAVTTQDRSHLKSTSKGSTTRVQSTSAKISKIPEVKTRQDQRTTIAEKILRKTQSIKTLPSKAFVSKTTAKRTKAIQLSSTKATSKSISKGTILRKALPPKQPQTSRLSQKTKSSHPKKLLSTIRPPQIMQLPRPKTTILRSRDKKRALHRTMLKEVLKRMRLNAHNNIYSLAKKVFKPVTPILSYFALDH